MQQSTTAAAILFALLSWPLAADDGAEASRQTALDMIEAINERDLDALDTVVAPNMVRHSAATPGATIESLDQFKAFLTEDFKAVPDSQVTVDTLLATENMVAIRAIYAGTQTGPMGPFPPSDKKVELPFLGILRIEAGKIVEMWVEWDNLYMLTQLGHFPPPDAEPAADNRCEACKMHDRQHDAACAHGGSHTPDGP